jgi:hypothetical protein
MSRFLFCLAALGTLTACDMMMDRDYDHQRSDWNSHSTSRSYNGYDGRSAYHNTGTMDASDGSHSSQGRD